MKALAKSFSNTSRGVGGGATALGWLDIATEHGVAARTPSHKARDERSVRVRLLNLAASFVVAWRCIMDPDAVLGCAVAVGCTLFYWHWGQHLSANMSWNIVSLAVIFPISQGIGMGFKRREQALGEFGHLLGNVRALWGAVHSWKVKHEGEWVRCVELMEQDERAAVDSLFEEFLAALVAYFDVPRVGRARQIAGCGGEEQAELVEISHEQRLKVDSGIGRMQRLVQHLKTLGLPGGEAHRLDQYISKVGIAFERLCCLKEYRTPQAFRAFARVYILLIGALYGPYCESTRYLVLSRACRTNLPQNRF